MPPSAGSSLSPTGTALRDPLGHWGRGPQPCSVFTAPGHTTDPGWQCQCAARGASGNAGLNKMRPNPVPGAGVCLQGAQQAAPTASTFCHPHHPTHMPCSSGGDNLLREPSPLSDECLCPPALSCVGDGPHGCCEEIKPFLWQSHQHWAELAVPPRQPSPSPVPLCPLWERASCAGRGGSVRAHTYPRWGTRVAGLAWNTPHPARGLYWDLAAGGKAGMTSQSQKGCSPLGECQRWDRMGTGSGTA